MGSLGCGFGLEGESMWFWFLLVVGFRFMREETRMKKRVDYVRCLGLVNFLVLILKWMGLVEY